MSLPSTFRLQVLAPDAPLPWDLLLLADPDRERVSAYMPGATVLVASIEEEVMACYVLSPLTVQVAEIKNIAVAPAWQGRGLGRVLLEDAIVRATSLGFHRLLIGTGNSSLRQLAIYQKAGFALVEVKWGFFDTYPEPIIEEGIPCRHLLLLGMDL